MLRKNMLLGLITALAFATIVVAQSSDIQSTIKSGFSLNSEKSLSLKFTEQTSFSDVEQIIYQYGLVPKDFNFEIENPYGETIYGGYTVDSNLTLDEALADFKQKHEEFFQEATKALVTDIRNEKDTTVRFGLRKLRNQFSMLFEDYKRNGLKLSSITVSESSNLSLLTKDNRFEKIELISSKVKPDISLDVSSEANAASYSWQPYRGSSKVNKGITFQVFYFRDVSGFGSNSTYEHETQVYNTKFANYANYYQTNLPSGYKDTQFLDWNGIDNFTVGTPYASQLKKETQYYTSMALSPESVATATVRIKGQIGHRTPSWCSSTWCIFGDATTPSLIIYTAPINNQINW